MSRVYYDFEFLERGQRHAIMPISLGMVAEDGRELYRVFAGFDQIAVSMHPWLVENVMPQIPWKDCDECPPGHVDFDHPDVAQPEVIREEVRAFLAATEDLELWGNFVAYDHVVLAQLFGTMMDLPAGVPMYTNDLQQEVARLCLDSAEISLLPKAAIDHHPLHEARQFREIRDCLARKERGMWPE